MLASFHQPFVRPKSEIVSLAGASRPGHWRAVHFLAADCPCSRRVMLHLLERGRLPELDEFIVLIGEGRLLPEPGQLTALGFQIVPAGEDAPGEFGLKGVPLLAIVSPNGENAYLGGYGAAYSQDIALWNKVRRGDSPTALPVIGCAVGQRVRRQADPWYWKYGVAPQTRNFL